jgi:hypothetical protein
MVWILRKAKKRLFRHDEGRLNGKFDLDLLAVEVEIVNP